MFQNVGGIDRVWRFIAGPILIAAAFLAPVGQGMQIVLGVFGAAMLTTGLVRW